MAQNAYQVLGVEQTASTEELKKAYRRLAKEVHPDRNKAENAKERFEEIVEAYDMLSDAETRKTYDEFLRTGVVRTEQTYGFKEAFETLFRNRRTTANPVDGESIQVTALFTVQAAIAEEEVRVIFPQKRPCGNCKGVGQIVVGEGKCKACGGEGTKPKKIVSPFGTITTSERCGECKGTGKAKSSPCPTCGSTGTITEEAGFAVKIPRGVHDGKRAIIAGEGHAGRDGGRSGDLCIIFKHNPQDRYTLLETGDVLLKENISLKNALLGCHLAAMLPNGTEMMLSIMPGVQTGDRLSVPGEGMYLPHSTQRGSFIIELNVQIPRDLTKKQTDGLAKLL